MKFVELYSPYAEGLKTGFICASGFNIVGSATRDGRRLIAVALGFRRADLRDEFLVRLFDQAFALKTAGSRPKIWQVRNEGGTPGNVLPQGECGMIRYDLPGDAAWLGTYGDWRTARRVYDTGQADLVTLGVTQIGKEYILPVTAGKVTRQAAIIADLEPAAAQKLCAAYKAKKLFCEVKKPTDFAPPFQRLLAVILAGPPHSCDTAPMNWLTNFVRPKLRALVARKEAPENLWLKCPKCEQMLFMRDWEANQEVCTHCGHHMRIRPLKRLPHLFDEGKYELHPLPKVPADPLKFRDTERYDARLKKALAKAEGTTDALVVASGLMGSRMTVIAALDFGFMGGSMGTAVGEGR